MDKATRKKLERAGWKVGSTQEFLDLSDADMAMIDLKISAGSALREKRTELGLTQTQLADLIGSSQSRIAKMEVSDPSVSLDLLVKTLLRLGTSQRELGSLLAPRKTPTA